MLTHREFLQLGPSVGDDGRPWTRAAVAAYDPRCVWAIASNLDSPQWTLRPLSDGLPEPRDALGFVLTAKPCPDGVIGAAYLPPPPEAPRVKQLQAPPGPRRTPMPPRVTEAISDAPLQQVVRRAEELERVRAAFEQQVPPALSQYVRLANIRDGTAVLLVTSSAFRAKCRVMDTELKAAFAAAGVTIKEILTRVADFRYAQPGAGLRAPAAHTAQAAEGLLRTSAGMEHGPLREQLESLASALAASQRRTGG